MDQPNDCLKMATTRLLQGCVVALSLALLATPADARLANISTRMQAMNGSNPMIAGFIISGTTNNTVVVTAKGPSLVAYGVANALPDPTLSLVRMSDQSVVATNDNWGSAANASALTASGFAPSNALESAVLVSLAPGAYTAIVSPAAGTAMGVGLVEVYEVDHPEVPIINISTRGEVGTDFNVMIGGFVITGNTPQQVVVTAKGPSLADPVYGIADPLMDPALNIVRSSDQAVMASNDNWGTVSNLYDLAISCFAPKNAYESAALVTLQPGAYTAIVAGVGQTTGTGLVEVYDYDGSINCLASANSSAIHKGVLGKSYTYNLPRKADTGLYSSGFLQQADSPWTPTELTVEWAISPTPGDFDYYKSTAASYTYQSGLSAYPCGGVYGASSAAVYWSLAGSAYECKVDNTHPWYINVRYLNNCAPGSNSPYFPGCPVSYFHSEY